MTPDDDIIARALDYPYPRPENSFLFSGGGAQDLAPDTDFAGLMPVLACGSNGSPEQLRRKFGGAKAIRIPVTAAIMSDICCTYSAHFSSYGSVAAGLSVAPGARSLAHITWLDPEQLERMHETEAIGHNYRFARLDSLALHCAHHGGMTSVYAYISLRGSLTLNGAPVTLGGIKCEDAPFPALDQTGVQSALRNSFAPGMDLHDFIRQNIENDDLRAERTACLGRTAQKFDFPGITTLLE
jgi:hypothetical protein